MINWLPWVIIALFLLKLFTLAILRLYTHGRIDTVLWNLGNLPSRRHRAKGLMRYLVRYTKSRLNR